MRFDSGTIDIPTATTRVRWTSDSSLKATDRFLWAQFQARDGNTGVIYVGASDVAAAQGWELHPTATEYEGRPVVIDPGAYGGTIAVQDIYFDAATNGDDVDWMVILEA